MLLLCLLGVAIINMILELVHRVILARLHAEPAQEIQMSSVKVALLVSDREMHLQVPHLLGMASQSAHIAPNTGQIFGVTHVVHEVFVVQVVLAVLGPQVLLHGRQVRVIVVIPYVAKAANEGHIQMALPHMFVHFGFRVQLFAAITALLLNVD